MIINSQTSTVQPLEFGNKSAISCHCLVGKLIGALGMALDLDKAVEWHTPVFLRAVILFMTLTLINKSQPGNLCKVQ